MPELFRGATWLSQSNGPFFLSVRLGCRLLCTYLVALGEDSFGVYWFIWGARRWLAVTAVSPECWGATGSGGLSVGRAGASPSAPAALPAHPRVLSWARAPVTPQYAPLGGRGCRVPGSLTSPFVYLSLPAWVLLQKQLLGQRAIHSPTRGGGATGPA